MQGMKSYRIPFFHYEKKYSKNSVSPYMSQLKLWSLLIILLQLVTILVIISIGIFMERCGWVKTYFSGWFETAAPQHAGKISVLHKLEQKPRRFRLCNNQRSLSSGCGVFNEWEGEGRESIEMNGEDYAFLHYTSDLSLLQ